uniref:Reverse transcriptase domain-containing protein n=1 Tax=Anolis carolinensis TaxID=28377 RepID=A0A803TR72_ANOCA
MIFGDFNGVLDTNLDKSTSCKRNRINDIGSLPKNMMTMKEEFALQDLWRFFNPVKRDYTFFSYRHNSWSRIDMAWVSNSIITNISEIKILPRDRSDHSPIEILFKHKPKQPKWRMDDNLIKKEADISRYKKLTREYFEMNALPETKRQTVWDAYKAVIRGLLIQQKAKMNKQKYRKSKELEKAIESNEKLLKINPNNKTASQELKALKKEKGRMEMEETAKKLKFIRQYNFENANKPGTWLARLVRKKKQHQLITKIKKDNKILSSDQNVIEEFHKYYTQLYKEEDIDVSEIADYLGKQKLDKISDTQRELLNKEISEDEIRRAIKSMKTNKAPGPDGFPASFYKTFQDDIIHFLKDLMNQILQGQDIPDSWKTADIICIPKENTDNTDVRNYRPISLLNSDYKMFSNILANRLKDLLNTWIAEDQKGFLPGRKMRDNVRCILDIIEYYEKNHQKEVALLSVDAEKAFDNLNWNFFKLAFQEIDIGFHFKNAINKIYERQNARVMINGRTSAELKIEKGTRQGCPLSPLIFIFALEILLRNINQDKETRGLRINKKDFKVRAFADDVICIVEEPRKNIESWIIKIEEFGKLAGFHLNKKKTKMLTKNITKKNQETLQKITGIEVVPKIKYLGIWLTKKNAQLLENNYYQKWKEISKDLKKWTNLKISLLGRIALVKMNILPKMLYLFQNLPIIRNAKIFDEWNKEISKFIWKGKKPRIKYLIMTDTKNRGGFGLPNLRIYFEASALTWVLEWATLKDEKILDLEGFDLRRGWHAYIGYEKRTIEKNFGNHFVRSSLIKIWEKYKKYWYRKVPMWISPLEAMQRRILGWKNWPRYKEVLTKTKEGFQLKSQDEIKKKYSNLTWFQYAQIKESYTKDKQTGFNDVENTWDKLLRNDKKSITKLYNKLLEWSTEIEGIKNCMTKWAQNIGRPIKLSEWEQIWNQKQNYTYSLDLKENWLKMFHRWYITPEKLGLMYKNVQNNCWKCKNIVGSYFHVWWSCEETQKFWRKIHSEIQKILKKSFPLKPEYFLLGITDVDTCFNRNEDVLFTYMITAARITFAKSWKTQDIPDTEQWLEKLEDIYDMDKLTFLLRQHKGKPIKQTDWKVYEEYRKNK